MATKPTAKKPAAKPAQRSLADIDTRNLSPAQIAAMAEETAGTKTRKPRHKVSTSTTEKTKKAAKTTGRDKETVKYSHKKADPSIKSWDGTTERPKGKTITKPTGRPSSFTQAMADTICQKIGEGNSLRKICLADDMPNMSTVCLWLSQREDFSKQYKTACDVRADVMFEQMLEISDDGQNDTYEDSDGNKRVDQDVIARSRLRVETRKWMIGKMKPKVYGDKVDVNHGVQPDNPIVSLLASINGTALPVVKNTEED